MAKTQKSGLSAKLRPGVVAKHAGDETSYAQNFAELPGNVSGIAELADCKIDVFKTGNNKGEYYFYAAGIVCEVDGEEHQECINRRTSLTIPICDTTARSGRVTTQEEHLGTIQNEMRKLGYNTSEMQDGEDLEIAAQALLEAAPYFRFNTTQGRTTKEFPNPRVWHNWEGIKNVPEGYERPETNGVVDNTAVVPAKSSKTAAPEPEGTDLEALATAADGGDEGAGAELQKLALAAGVSSKKIKQADSWQDVLALMAPEGSAAAASDEDLYAIGKAADEGDAAAQQRLEELGEEHGEPDKDYPSYADWAGVIANKILSGGGEEDEPPFEPEKGKVYSFKPPRARKPVQVECTAVFGGRETCNLKSLVDGKTFKGIAWDKLELD